MRSSTSSSEAATADELGYQRPLPQHRGGMALLIALALWVAGMAAWEICWRNYGAEPAIRNSEGLWAAQRRRINHGEGEATVIASSSRLLFDLQLPVWESLTGERPIQLGLEGTSAVPVLENLADDPDFNGRLIVGVSPNLFFSGFAYRKKAIERFGKETPAQWLGQQISQHLLEPWLAFYEPDFALFTVLERQRWPEREGVPVRLDVRKLSVMSSDRNARLWSKVENDPDYAALARRIWAQGFDRPPPGGPEAARRNVEAQIDRAVAAVTRLRARGVPVVFVRAPSDGEFLASEERNLPRAQTWDELIRRSGVPGIHFQDYPELQGYRLPEWSHMTGAEADRFTAAIQPLIEAAFVRQEQGD